MASLTPGKISAGARIFLDSTIFIYHFTGSSEQCRDLLQRCERGEITGLTSVVVLAEVAHRLMLIEALNNRLVSGKNLVQKLRERPEVVQKLHLYQEQVEKITIMGIEIVPLDLKTFLRSDELRILHGLLMNDSLIAASAIEAEAVGIASADPDFARVKSLRHFMPSDIVA